MASLRFSMKLFAIVVLCSLVVTGAWIYYQRHLEPVMPDFIASGNGRIEAVEYDIATKYPGRLEKVLVNEGDMVEQDQLLAKMNTDSIKAQLREAQAGLREAKDGRDYALAMVTVRQSELVYAQREQTRAAKLASSGHVSQEKLDQSNTQYVTAAAILKAAHIQVTRAQSGIEAAEAAVARLQAELDETNLSTPIKGRVLYKLAQVGEVLGSGGNVFTILDLTDVSMSVFVPTEQAGKIQVGSEARIILDAIPQYVIPATISFVAARTQFTPKAVETRSEREKLMFRVKVTIDPKLLREHIEAVKTGVPGEAYILLDQKQSWPESLLVNLP
ncbi:HlyD family secretion protein [Neptunomonas antarctica]|uniref:HlyD family secretion protein n=1 Tax=Neptunomonas antarctica TaxID=619304 RepID=A0A1N7M8J4_9GAMM|nr:HlyD family efflux transporter periplasmic adaptor subunit [Neptunomonas antarctica]SIS82394.1 HlyD family secretion protein [Neptunomonas antarctica]